MADATLYSIALMYTPSAAGPLPNATSINPASGLNSGLYQVTLGSGDATFTADCSVMVGPNPGTGVIFDSTSQIRFTMPAGAVGPASVVVTNSNGSDPTPLTFTYTAPPPPTIDLQSTSPASGPTTGGNWVQFLGANMTGATTIELFLSGVWTPCAFPTFQSPNRVDAQPPAFATPGFVSARAVDPVNGTDVLANAYQYTLPPPPAPTATSCAPAFGRDTGLDVIDIGGTGFTGDTTFRFDPGAFALTGVQILSATSARATTPAHAAGTVDLVATNAGGSGAALVGAFTYMDTGAGTPGGISWSYPPQ